MKFKETELDGVYIVEPEPVEDHRGFFARTFCKEVFSQRGLENEFVQCSISFNKKKGTLRGIHFQSPPHQEAKLITCRKGSIFDVVVDVRRHSQTFGKWTSVELTEENRNMVYVPEGCAHGFQTLQDNSEVFYQISKFYESGNAKGLRWDDDSIGISWPLEVQCISQRDLALPYLSETDLY